MKLSKVRIKNYRSIKDSGDIVFTDDLFVLAGQNESGKSSVLEALKSYEEETFDRDTLNFEEEQEENYIQSVSCTYKIIDSEKFIKDLISELKEKFVIKEEDFLDVEKIKKIKEFTITKEYDHNSDTLTIKLNGGIIGLLKGAVLSSVVTNTNESGEEIEIKEFIIDVDNKKDEIAVEFWRLTPNIILFSDFSDLLPDKILISDLESANKDAKGYGAVRKLESIMGNKTFLEISNLNNAQKKATTSKIINAVSVTFTQDWQQKIYGNNDVRISFSIENDNVASKAVKTVFFYIETQDNVPLEPRKRSKGMIWFLSAWLSLKSKENDGKLIILFDEPGLYLHVKAQKDMLNLFKYLTEKKEHQIIYSTHSPSLIDIDKLYNIGLVINTKSKGTLVEGLTTSKINTSYKKDALQPIAEAMGLDIDVGVLGEKNILLEGLSDFYYFQAMSKILNKENLYKFVPGIGIKNGKIYHLISFCLGYGLDWVLIMDDGTHPQEIKKELKKNIFNDNGEDTAKKVHILEDINGIENIFSCDDLLLIDEKIQCNEEDDKVKKIGNARKIIFAKTFLQKVNGEKIKKENISQDTIEKWEKIFEWVKIQFENESN
ncbi:ATP-dependent nuclease [Sulfurimonas hydrogeniphila]|uniref:ATP-dependent nuclease n=1 Tax=Sulfurimonas hydrogeniphila TaxID=2509341 RepID=UPI00125F5D56|nr:AAA family ATPase [Sulfurimonas hydrogeniphila]